MWAPQCDDQHLGGRRDPAAVRRRVVVSINNPLKTKAIAKV
jgi:hypothetical protein